MSTPEIATPTRGRCEPRSRRAEVVRGSDPVGSD
jgi:hypothetical protein